MDNFDDVGVFHQKFGLVNSTFTKPHPRLLDDDTYAFRYGFLAEELREFKDAHLAGNLAEAADALVDLVYVVLGTAHMMGLPWHELWDEVQHANMQKVRAPSAEASASSTGRGSVLDVIKPEGWQPPNIEGVLASYA